MLELILSGLEKYWFFVVLFLLWGVVAGTRIYVASRKNIIHLTGQSAELPGEIDEALRWLEELEERNKKMPDNKIYVDFNDERLLDAIKAGHYEFGPDIKFKYVEAHNDPFDPERYFCNICGRSNVKLWRQAIGFGMEYVPDGKIELLCAFCVGDMKGNNLRGKNVLGKLINKTSTILNYFPAIPMMNGEEYQSFISIRRASDDNILMNRWLKMDD